MEIDLLMVVQEMSRWIDARLPESKTSWRLRDNDAVITTCVWRDGQNFCIDRVVDESDLSSRFLIRSARMIADEMVDKLQERLAGGG